MTARKGRRPLITSKKTNLIPNDPGREQPKASPDPAKVIRALEEEMLLRHGVVPEGESPRPFRQFTDDMLNDLHRSLTAKIATEAPPPSDTSRTPRSPCFE